MNQFNYPYENTHELQESEKLSPLQVAGIFVAVGLLCAGLYQLLKSPQKTGSISSSSVSSGLSASEIMTMLDT